MGQPDIEHEGIVTGISESHILVRIIQQSACAGCHAASVCSTADKKEKIIEVEKPGFPVKTGEKVVVALSAVSGYKAVGFTIILPLLLLILSLATARLFHLNELLIGCCALSSLVVYYAILYLYRNRLKKQFTFFLKKTFVS